MTKPDFSIWRVSLSKYNTSIVQKKAPDRILKSGSEVVGPSSPKIKEIHGR
jgi:hypothetical protein